MANYTRSSKLESKKNRKKKVFIWISSIVFILVASGVTYASLLLDKAENVINEKAYEEFREKPLKAKPDPSDDNVSILFMGVDDSETRNYNGATRTDALILATFNEEEKSVKMLSIPRDSYVYLPAADRYDKINHAHVFDGVKGSVEAVENLFDIHIDYYVKLNFEAFLDVIDALGGVEVNVPYYISEKDSKDNHNAINLQPGMQTLNAEEALAFARTRKQDNDIERGKRQQEVLKAILKKSTSVGSFTKYGDLIEAIGSNMKTNMQFDEMKSFFGYVKTGTLNIETISLTGYDDKINGVYYYQLDQQSVSEVAQQIQSHLGENHVASTHSNEDVLE